MRAPQPNILWIVTTQWRAQACGYAGDPNARTPCLDALAAESVNYTQAVTPHPFGPFARAALLTGVSSPGNGVRDYFDPLRAGTRTIAHALNEQGYATAFFGKWHLGRRDPRAPMVGEAHAKTLVPPEARGGFGFWEGFESGFLLNDPWLHGTRLAEPVRFEGYQSDVLCERAADWVDAHEGRGARGGARSAGGGGQGRVEGEGLPRAGDEGSAGAKGMAGGHVEGREPSVPWFCVVSLESPHPPYNAPAAGVAARDGNELILPANVPRGGDVEARARRELAGYYAHIEATDRAIGRLLASGVADPARTIVVFTSVHGDMHGARGLFRKGWPHEESVRVPLLVRRPPGQVEGGGWSAAAEAMADRQGAGGREDDSAVSLVDLPAMTQAWASGLTPPASRLLSQISMPSVVALPHQCDRVWRGVRTKKRKLVLNADGSPWLFFDLEQNPLEMKNLAGDPARAEEIAGLARSTNEPDLRIV
jgi:arylsulfatase A-like enzyme